MLDVSDYNIFDIKTSLDAVEHWYSLKDAWERIKRSESYNNISISQLEEVLKYKDNIEIKLEIERELEWNKFLETTEGTAYTLNPKLHDELTEIRQEMEVRRERLKVRERNKELEELFTNEKYLKYVEEKTGKPFNGAKACFLELPKCKLPQLDNHQLLDRYNSIIKSFRLQGINLHEYN